MKQRTLFLSCSAVVLVLLCLALAGLGWYAYTLPDRAAALYGPPAPGLDLFQRTKLSYTLLRSKEQLMQPRDPQGAKRVFLVQLGEPIASIAARLEGEGIIPNASALTDFLVYSGLDTTLQAGEHELGPAMTSVQVALALQDATPSEVTFPILPGWRLEEVAISLPTSGLGFTPAEFMDAVRAATHPSLLPGASLEGFLLPGNYHLPRQVSLPEFLDIVLDNFDSQVDDELRAGFERQGLDLFQAVSLASIVQREAILEEEMPQIASVFLNRLAVGMNLDSDATVQYAIGYNQGQDTWWTNPLSGEDLQIDSPYNTYLYPGLPPGPIANPGLAALRAVAFPAQTPYYFFRAACDGSGRHLFAVTFEQHVNNACP